MELRAVSHIKTLRKQTAMEIRWIKGRIAKKIKPDTLGQKESAASCIEGGSYKELHI